MRTTKQLSITLPNNMADAPKERVASGAYASESEVVRDGRRALFAREEAVENWLRTRLSLPSKSCALTPRGSSLQRRCTLSSPAGRLNALQTAHRDASGHLLTARPSIVARNL